jgi:hypothetical protein
MLNRRIAYLYECTKQQHHAARRRMKCMTDDSLDCDSIVLGGKECGISYDFPRECLACLFAYTLLLPGICFAPLLLFSTLYLCYLRIAPLYNPFTTLCLCSFLAFLTTIDDESGIKSLQVNRPPVLGRFFRNLVVSDGVRGSFILAGFPESNHVQARMPSSGGAERLCPSSLSQALLTYKKIESRCYM